VSGRRRHACHIARRSWLAVAGGAHGLGFFPAQWSPPLAEAVAGVAQDVKALGLALFAPEVPVRATRGGIVQAIARSYNGALYVIAINTALRPARLALGVSGLGGRSLHVLGGQRVLASDGDTFYDRLPALGVAIYAAAPA
jgi:hypothetical protein